MLMAVGLGEAVRAAGHPLGTGLRWILAGGLSVYLLVTRLAIAFTRRLATWRIFAMGLVLIAAPLLLAAVLAMVVGGQVMFRRMDVKLKVRLVTMSP